MPHIHTQPGQHDATASALIFRFDTSEPQLLLHMHKKVHHLLQPGGHVELHETPWQAILHEIPEETGYQLDQLRIFQPVERLKQLTGVALHPLPLVENTHAFDDTRTHFHTDRMYVFAADGAPLGTPGEDESSDLRWVTLKQLLQYDDALIFPNTKELCEYAFNHCITRWQPVPLTDFEA